MLFEWDETKSERTRRVRGLDFDAAARIFEGLIYEFLTSVATTARNVW